MMIKVCHVTSAHRNDDPRIFQKECTTLAMNGYDVYYVAPGNSFLKNGVHVIGVAKKKFAGFFGKVKRLLFFSRSVYMKAKKLDCDIYHFHDPDMLRYAIKFSKKGKRVIFDFHEEYHESILNNERKSIPRAFVKLAAKYYLHLQNKVCRFASGCIVVNPQMYGKWTKYSENVIQITNYPIICPAISNFKKKKNLIVFAGKNPDNYSQDIFIKAISSIPDIEYHIYGDISAQRKSELLAISSRGISFKGTIPFDQMYQVIAEAAIGMAVTDIFFVDGDKKGSIGNTKLFEYMMMKVPVICTNYDNWKKIVENDQCGICVDPHDVGEIRDAVNKILNDSILAETMGKNGRLMVEKKYNWANDAKTLLAFYDSLVHAKLYRGKRH